MRPPHRKPANTARPPVAASTTRRSTALSTDRRDPRGDKTSSRHPSSSQAGSRRRVRGRAAESACPPPRSLTRPPTQGKELVPLLWLYLQAQANTSKVETGLEDTRHGANRREERGLGRVLSPSGTLILIGRGRTERGSRSRLALGPRFPRGPCGSLISRRRLRRRGGSGRTSENGKREV